LTIQPGGTVNLNGYFIQVNGTLVANGTDDRQIRLESGKITFTLLSDTQTGLNSVIENTVLNTVVETHSSPTIKGNIITATISISGSSVISYNTIKSDLSVLPGSPRISNNLIMNSKIQTYLGKTADQNTCYLPFISNNSITGGGIECYGGNGYGGYAEISGNTISGCNTAILGGDGVIERNYIFGNTVGIEIENGVIQNNTIFNNSIGINIPKVEIYSFGFGELCINPTIQYNNIYGNTNSSIYSNVSNDIYATNNWWKTTDAQAINQTIRDSKNDFALGTVNFVPFLTGLNSQAPSLEIPISTPTPTSSPTPTAPEFPSAVVFAVLVIMSTAAISVYRRRLKLNCSIQHCLWLLAQPKQSPNPAQTAKRNL
jgi:hypothetical protein